MGNENKNGQVIVEALIAAGIIVVGLLAVFSLASRSLSLNRVVADQYVGVNLAAEGVELVKNLLDKNVIQHLPFNQGVSAGNYEMDYADTTLEIIYRDRPLLFDSATGLYGYSSGKDTLFRRKITIEKPIADEIKVISSVSWTTRGGGQFNVNLEDHFFNWR